MQSRKTIINPLAHDTSTILPIKLSPFRLRLLRFALNSRKPLCLASLCVHTYIFLFVESESKCQPRMDISPWRDAFPLSILFSKQIGQMALQTGLYARTRFGNWFFRSETAHLTPLVLYSFVKKSYNIVQAPTTKPYRCLPLGFSFASDGLHY